MANFFFKLIFQKHIKLQFHRMVVKENVRDDIEILLMNCKVLFPANFMHCIVAFMSK